MSRLRMIGIGLHHLSRITLTGACRLSRSRETNSQTPSFDLLLSVRVYQRGRSSGGRTAQSSSGRWHPIATKFRINTEHSSRHGRCSKPRVTCAAYHAIDCYMVSRIYQVYSRACVLIQYNTIQHNRIYSVPKITQADLESQSIKKLFVYKHPIRNQNNPVLCI